MLYLIWVAIIVAALMLYFKQVYSMFSNHGVKTLKPLPILGNMGGVIFRKQHSFDAVMELYNAFPEERFVGKYEFLKPQVLVRDIELIKKITVKDFEHFLDHRTVVDVDADPFFGRNLFSLKGQEWKDMRSTLSPAFTSSKMKLMVPFMVEVGEQMISSLNKRIEESGVSYIDIDAKDLCTRYANDVIASCAFGLKVDSHNEQNNKFYEMGKAATTFNIRQTIMLIAYMSNPKIMKNFSIKLFSEKTTNFFKDLVLGTMRNREEQHILRPDMIHLLMEAKKGKLSHEEKSTKDIDAGFATVEESDVGKKQVNRDWADNDLVAQAMLFFIAGFETVSSAMSFLVHELAVNPDIQEKLAQEIQDNYTKTGGKFDYNTIQSLPYLDMVISETLRLWSPFAAMDRICVKDYNMGKPNPQAKHDFVLKKGTSVALPIYPIQRDPEYFPDPLKFDPERFSEENKHSIKPFTYSPFGLGPRNCIGSRFALCEVKVMAYQLFQQFEISPCEKTCIPAQLSMESVNLLIKGGHWIRLRRREVL